MKQHNIDDQTKVKRRDVLKATVLMMGGMALTTSATSIILNACAATAGEDWTPEFFTKGQINLIAEVAERIIPRTDTPGAKDALVHRVIDESVKSNLSVEEQTGIVESLKLFDQKSQESFQKEFVDCSDEQKDAILTDMANEAMNQMNSENKSPHIFTEVRSIVIGTYMSSEIAAKEVLVYDPIPGEYQGCIDFSDVGGVWAL